MERARGWERREMDARDEGRDDKREGGASGGRVTRVAARHDYSTSRTDAKHVRAPLYLPL